MPKPLPKSRRSFHLPHPQPLDALSCARFTGIPTFMRLPHTNQPEELEVALIGVPFDGGTSYRTGPRFGPRNIRVQSAMIRPYQSCSSKARSVGRSLVARANAFIADNDREIFHSDFQNS